MLETVQYYWLLRITYLKQIFLYSVLKSLDFREQVTFYKCDHFLHTNIYPHLTQYLSVADNARDAVLLHVSASSERQECGNNLGLMKKKI